MTRASALSRIEGDANAFGFHKENGSMSDPDEFHLHETAPDPLAHATILKWVDSGGFASTHDQGATPTQIADDLLRFLDREGWALVTRPYAKHFRETVSPEV